MCKMAFWWLLYLGIRVSLQFFGGKLRETTIKIIETFGDTRNKKEGTHVTLHF